MIAAMSSTSASSIKTRIKTVSSRGCIRPSLPVRVHHPLKQGLRLSARFPNSMWASCTSASSIKTRIKTSCYDDCCNEHNRVVRVHHPLKQGLRRLLFLRPELFFIIVRVHHPLKQGLRRASSSLSRLVRECTSASSIKTRIKTGCINTLICCAWCSTSASSIKTRIKTCHNSRAPSYTALYECIIH